jgi:hypothetical protein
VAREGGAAAAIEKAVRYLDAFHSEDRLRKVRTETACGPIPAFPPAERDGYASPKPSPVPALREGIALVRERR